MSYTDIFFGENLAISYKTKHSCPQTSKSPYLIRSVKNYTKPRYPSMGNAQKHYSVSINIVEHLLSRELQHRRILATLYYPQLYYILMFISKYKKCI